MPIFEADDASSGRRQKKILISGNIFSPPTHNTRSCNKRAPNAFVFDLKSRMILLFSQQNSGHGQFIYIRCCNVFTVKFGSLTCNANQHKSSSIKSTLWILDAIEIPTPSIAMWNLSSRAVPRKILSWLHNIALVKI